MAVYEFNPQDFRTAFPEFSSLTDGQLEMQFDVACLLIDNSESSLIPYDPPADKSRRTILLTAMAHIAERNSWASGQTGALASASQGSVSTSFAAAQGTDEWWTSTRYGQLVLRMLLPYVLGGRLYTPNHYHPWG